MWLLNKAEESPLFGSYSLKAHISSLRWLQQYPLAALCPPNSSATLPPPVDDVAFYPSHIWGKNSFSLLLAHIFFPICISPFFACSLSSFFTCLLEDLSSLFPPLAVCWSFSFKTLFFSPFILSCLSHSLVFAVFREGLMKGQRWKSNDDHHSEKKKAVSVGSWALHWKIKWSQKESVSWEKSSEWLRW